MQVQDPLVHVSAEHAKRARGDALDGLYGRKGGNGGAEDEEEDPRLAAEARMRAERRAREDARRARVAHAVARWDARAVQEGTGPRAQHEARLRDERAVQQAVRMGMSVRQARRRQHEARVRAERQVRAALGPHRQQVHALSRPVRTTEPLGARVAQTQDQDSRDGGRGKRSHLGRDG